MRIYIIRHGEPDYEHDTLTEHGKTEAHSLAKLIPSLNLDHVYSSPLGRTQLTAKIAMGERASEIVTLDWLQEFTYDDGSTIPPTNFIWDKYPDEWVKHPELFTKEGFENSPVIIPSIKEKYKMVGDGLKTLLARHGYESQGKGVYTAVKPNRESIALFCHFGMESILLSHLFDVSPMTLLQFTCARTTSVTTIYTEERRQGIASFRLSAFGELNHFYSDGIEPNFHARYCETFDSDEIH